MSYGISILNSSGFVQIDPDYSNYAVLVRGTASGNGYVYIDFPAQPKPPLVFAKFAATDRWLALTQLTNSRATFFIYPNDGWNTAASGSFSYAICVPFEDISLPNDQFGFRVFNQSGGVVFDSGVAMPVIESVHSLDLYDSRGGKTASVTVADYGDARWILANDIGSPRGIYNYGVNESYIMGPAFRSPSNSVISVTGSTVRGIIYIDDPNWEGIDPAQLVVLRSL